MKKTYPNPVRCSCLLTFLFALLMPNIGMSQLVTNATFELDTIGDAPPAPFTTASDTGANSITVEDTSSIASSALGTGVKSVYIVNGSSTSGSPALYAPESADLNQALMLSADFYLPAASWTSSNNISLAVYGVSSSSGLEVQAYRVTFRGSSDDMNLQDSNGTSSPSLAINSWGTGVDEWYRITLSVGALDTSEDTLTLSIYDSSGTLISSAANRSMADITSITQLRLWDNSAGSTVGSFYVDNVSLSTIPEPQASSMLFLIGVGLLAGASFFKLRAAKR
ncbi:hypothetical protein [Ruficoccus sp. ZRK36]|uniref:hypothetical protein n=1 Tax=Ruficoccus sp. ZRK36 TaxID=2866311 RepID=UPI001C72DE20|nr:hypothetical protein [Ruficoccus sp. ZRK36]QYY37256.1 hypothetical protein K0V07_07175 [Ruficoccus sp. ZRK36]